VAERRSDELGLGLEREATVRSPVEDSPVEDSPVEVAFSVGSESTLEKTEVQAFAKGFMMTARENIVFVQGM
jgi:hypothetical protein